MVAKLLQVAPPNDQNLHHVQLTKSAINEITRVTEYVVPLAMFKLESEFIW